MEAYQEEVKALQARLNAQEVAYKAIKNTNKRRRDNRLLRQRTKFGSTRALNWKQRCNNSQRVTAIPGEQAGDMRYKLRKKQSNRTMAQERTAARKKTARDEVRAIRYRLAHDVINATTSRQTEAEHDIRQKIKSEPGVAKEEDYPVFKQPRVIDKGKLRLSVAREYSQRIKWAKEGRNIKLTKPERDNIYLGIIDEFEAAEQIQIRPL